MILPRRSLGGLDIAITPLALGSVKFGRNHGVKYPRAFELPGDKALVDLLSLAKSFGINFIDTAPAYGTSEARIGKLLQGSRHDWVICTKAGEQFDGSSSTYNYSATAMNKSVDNSLKALKTDYLDIVLIHSDGNDLDILHQSDALATLAARQRSGDIRYIGLSGKTIEGAQAAIGLCDVLMVTLNLADVSHLGVIEQAATLGKGILVKKALDSGHGNPADNLAFVLTQPGVSSAVIGTINPDHLSQNVRIASDTLSGTTTHRLP